MGLDKTRDKRVHITQMQMAKIVEYSVKNPSKKYQDVLEWATEELKLSETPSTVIRHQLFGSLCMWRKSKTKKSFDNRDLQQRN
jgi:hypothetical protein